MDRERLNLTVGPPVFAVTVSPKDRAILAGWGRATSLKNVLWHSTYCFRLGWPPFAHTEGFVTDDE